MVMAMLLTIGGGFAVFSRPVPSSFGFGVEDLRDAVPIFLV